jgi:hypothetical protein
MLRVSTTELELRLYKTPYGSLMKPSRIIVTPIPAIFQVIAGWKLDSGHMKKMDRM